MIINFIAASNGIPLAKNLITGESYPNVTDVSSFAHEGDDIDWLASTLNMHAQANNALLTGGLDRRIVNESRSGHSLRGPTGHMVLDVDADLPYTRDELLALAGIDCDYVFQHSASATSEVGVRGHFFVLLNQPTEPSKIKDFLRHLNVTVFRDYLKLSNSLMSIKWPIDIVVNDPGRIVYIAPPVVANDPIKDRIITVRKGIETFTVPDVDATDVTPIINELRGALSLPAKNYTPGTVINVDPNEVKITGQKEDRGFIYLNLNGGDSWGYFFNPNSPDIVHNFKDEPEFRLKDLDPALHAKYAVTKPAGGVPMTLGPNGLQPALKPAVFLDPSEDTYYRVIYDPATGEVDEFFPTPSRAKLNDFMMQRGEPKPTIIFDGKAEFNPQNTIQYNPATRYLNMFKSTKYLESTKAVKTIPPNIEKIIRSVTVDDECYHHFINWLAYIYQYRDKTGTAWLFHGTTATGKGALFKDILNPIFGDAAKICKCSNLMEQFNGQLRDTLIMVVDEFNINDLNTGGQQFNHLKNLITEKILTLRLMRQNQIQTRNYANYIMNTNDLIPIKLPANERRMNIPPVQPESLKGITEIRDGIPAELDDFAGFLYSFKVDTGKARTVLHNQARRKMMNDSRTSHEQFFDALKDGDLEFFNDFTKDAAITNILAYDEFERTITAWAEQSKTASNYSITREDLLIAYRYIVDPNKPITLLKFTAICKNNGVDYEATRVHSEPRSYKYKLRWKEAVDVKPKQASLKLVV